jgi:hypothetical protein
MKQLAYLLARCFSSSGLAGGLFSSSHLGIEKREVCKRMIGSDKKGRVGVVIAVFSMAMRLSKRISFLLRLLQGQVSNTTMNHLRFRRTAPQ